MSKSPRPALSEEALHVRRGCIRLLTCLGQACLVEVPLPNQRRADIVAIASDGKITIIEVKSGLPDFRADQKWMDYLGFCDAFYFAVDVNFPSNVLPQDIGYICADEFDGEIMRPSALEPLKAARRNALMRQLARLGAFRLTAVHDPRLRTGIIDPEG